MFIISDKISIFVSFLQGLTSGVYGPALLDLKRITNTDVATMATMLACKRGSSIIGALAGGVAYDKLDHILPIILATAVMGTTSIAIPWCSSIFLMIVMASFQGVANGMLETCMHYILTMYLYTYIHACIHIFTRTFIQTYIYT